MCLLVVIANTFYNSDARLKNGNETILRYFSSLTQFFLNVYSLCTTFEEPRIDHYADIFYSEFEKMHAWLVHWE